MSDLMQEARHLIENYQNDKQLLDLISRLVDRFESLQRELVIAEKDKAILRILACDLKKLLEDSYHQQEKVNESN